MKIRFSLHRPNERTSLIYLIVTDRKTIANWSTGLKVDPRKWDRTKGRAKKTLMNYRNLNALLGRLEDAIIAIYGLYWITTNIS